MVRLPLLMVLLAPAVGHARDVHVVGPGGAFSTINAAVTASEPGDVVMVEPGTWSECVNVSSDIQLVSTDGPGSTTISCNGFAAIVVTASEVLVSGFTLQGPNSGGVYANDSVLTLTDMVFDSLVSASGGAGIQATNTDVWVHDSTFSGNTGGRGASIRLVNGNLVAVHSTITGSSSTDSGGAISVVGGSTLLNSVVIDTPTAAADGGAIHTTATAVSGFTLNLVDVTIDGAQAARGGAVYTFNVPATIIGSGISGNEALSSPGGAIHTNASLWVHSSSFLSNTATWGGAIYAQQTDTTLIGSVFEDNVATVSGTPATGPGGAVAVDGGDLDTSDCTFTGNQASAGGGALWIDGDWYGAGDLFDTNEANNGGAVRATGLVDVYQSEFIGNVANNTGGALLVDGSPLQLQACRIEGNEATSGGGIYHAAATFLYLMGCVVDGNSAVDGGGVMVTRGAMWLESSHLTNNTASDRGGGAFYTNPVQMAGTGLGGQHSAVEGNTAARGGGLMVERGNIDLNQFWVCDNQATSGEGGGLEAWFPYTVQVRYTLLCANTASTLGGGAYAKGSANPPNFQWTVFQENSAGSQGGAYFEDGRGSGGAARTSFQDVTVFANSAPGFYGGLVANLISDASVSPSQFDVWFSVVQDNGQVGIATVGGALVANPIWVSETHFGGHTTLDVSAPGGWDQGGNRSDRGAMGGQPALPTVPIPRANWSDDGDCYNDLLVDQYSPFPGASNWSPFYSDDDADGWTFAERDCALSWDDTTGDASSRNPGAQEIPGNTLDEDCFEGADRDADVDGFVATGVRGGDCADNQAAINPDADDIAGDGTDQDCSGSDLFDADGDSMRPPTDCDETDATIHSFNAEVFYDGTDQDCDPSNDDDADLDGVTQSTDCDDFEDDRYPGAFEVFYDGLDADCGGDNDYDADGDGFVAVGYEGEAGGTAPGTGDCDDADPDVFPTAVETYYDGIDSNCDGLNDYDADGDGFVATAYNDEAGGSAPNTDDCDDTAAATYPGAVEVCDGVVNDCNFGGGGTEADVDSDGVLDAWESVYGLTIGNSDSDGDGIPDGVEWSLDDDDCHDGTDGPVNSDGADQIDALDTDSDNDHVLDVTEGAGDTDGDGFADFRDPDDDGDGITTSEETDGLGAPIDADGDGTPDYLDLDSDDDGALDASESTADTDGDGLGDWRDNGSDADEAADAAPATEPGTYGFGCASVPGAPFAGWLVLMLMAVRRIRPAATGRGPRSRRPRGRSTRCAAPGP